MHDADYRVADGDDVNVGGGQGVPEFREWLIGQRADVRGVGGFDFALADPAPHKKENQTRLVPHALGGLDQRADRIRRSVIAAVHHHHFSIEAVPRAERIGAVLHRCHVIDQRPRGDDVQRPAHVVTSR